MYNHGHVAGTGLQPHLDVCVIQILYRQAAEEPRPSSDTVTPRVKRNKINCHYLESVTKTNMNKPPYTYTTACRSGVAEVLMNCMFSSANKKVANTVCGFDNTHRRHRGLNCFASILIDSKKKVHRLLKCFLISKNFGAALGATNSRASWRQGPREGALEPCLLHSALIKTFRNTQG